MRPDGGRQIDPAFAVRTDRPPRSAGGDPLPKLERRPLQPVRVPAQHGVDAAGFDVGQEPAVAGALLPL
jgi:hypothetical protein